MPAFLTETKQIKELLRFTKASLQLEEALQLKLIPVRPNAAELEGRFYFKVDLRGNPEERLLDFLFRQASSHLLPIDQEILPFLNKIYKKDTLAKKYRMEIEHEFLFGFPTCIYQDRYGRERLSTLFKFTVDKLDYPLEEEVKGFQENQQSFTEAPSLTLRQNLSQEEGAPLTYMLDEFFMQEELGITDEELTKLRRKCRQKKLSPLDFVALFVQDILGVSLPSPASQSDASSTQEQSDEESGISRPSYQPIDLIQCLNQGIATKIQWSQENFAAKKTTRVFPFAIFYQLEDQQPTRQLQNDLQDLISNDTIEDLAQNHPAQAYLFGNNQEVEKGKKFLGKTTFPTLTPSQAEALLAVKRRKISVIQGPPGTGKTHLIRNLVADRLVQHASSLKYIDTPLFEADAVTVITSTNNRAVDNALMGLNHGAFLPVSLRVGSRIVFSQNVLPFLSAYLVEINQRVLHKEIKRFYQAKEKLIELLKQPESEQENKIQSFEEDETYLTAREVLDAWVGCNRDKVGRLLQKIIDEIKNKKALSSLKTSTNMALLLTVFPVIGSTLLSMRNFFPMKESLFGLLVVDESGQCSSAYLLPSLVRAKRVALLGDTKQLEPVSNLRTQDLENLKSSRKFKLPSEICQYFIPSQEISRSAQELGQDACQTSLFLREHFRCHPDIIQISALLCDYDLEIQPPLQGLMSPSLQYVNIQGYEQRYGSSWYNLEEVRGVISLIHQCLRRGFQLDDLAILTPFRGQTNHIQSALQQEKLPYYSGEEGTERNNALTTGTVHRFQGGEKKVVIFSHVISQGNPTFINSRVNLLNVAVSRARENFIFVGSMPSLDKGAFTSVLKDRLETKGIPFFPESF